MAGNRAELEKEIIDLEKEALNKWFKGDSSGYLELWSEKNFSYFDSFKEHRIDSHADIAPLVKKSVDGKLFADSYDFANPRVQFSNENTMGVLTYELHAKTNLMDMNYDCIEVYSREDNKWRVIHSTWSVIQPYASK